ncbi:pilus assembly protein PilM [Oceanirhabdus sp. W0125-5]|uniref:pilus assembly protein PilM n=1 Tax=Oceanirhabdus sp. W0125-5 TaxID=2999116 RepID=UPI0022F2B263|nr:pilus assembly protein PilM [Oceanirhabdus sp. W0125-5]WBW99585.1 pilus assembly protein PilM [Oceanirhabdus sp. W0125-5]
MLNINNKLCIDIGNNKIKITEAAISKNGINIKKAVILDTPENSFMDGNITNIISIKDEIERGLKENKIKCKNAIFTTNSSNIITREIEIPITKDKNIKGLIRTQMEQYLPLSYDAYVLEYIKLGNIDNKLLVRVGVFPKDMAKNYYDLCNNLRLKPVALDIHSNGVTKLIKKADKINGLNIQDGSFVLVDIGDSSITFNGYKNRELRFSRMIQSGFGDIFRYFYEERGESKDAVMKIIENIDLDKLSGEEDVESSIIYDTTLQWGREIERLLNYYSNTLKNEVDIIYVYGGGSKLKGIENILKEMVDIEVKKLKEINFKGIDLKNENIEMLINNIGASFRNGR